MAHIIGCFHRAHNKASERDDRMCGSCRDEFGAEDEQVLLPCSHTFHRVCMLPLLSCLLLVGFILQKCITSYERFTGSTSCPICRRNNIYKEHRLIHDALDNRRNEAAILFLSLQQ